MENWKIEELEHFGSRRFFWNNQGIPWEMFAQEIFWLGNLKYSPRLPGVWMVCFWGPVMTPPQRLGVWKPRDWEIALRETNLGGGFKYFLFSPLFGEMIQFD